MMAYNHFDPSRGYSVASGPVPVARPVPELKLYQFFIFCIPIIFTFVLLFLFYLFYLRRRRADWTSIRMRASMVNNNISTQSDVGLKKEFREMLPIIVYTETFFVNDTLCSVCLGEYKTEDKLQQIPACGHVFHMDCIDHWLSTHSTCPLCRLSVLSSAAHPSQPPLRDVEMGLRSSTNPSQPPQRDVEMGLRSSEPNGASHQQRNEADQQTGSVSFPD